MDIESVLKHDVVINWSGGLDSTGLIFYLLENYDCRILPIFVNRNQTNYSFEKSSVEYYTKIFSSNKKFNKPFEVTIISPPKEFTQFERETKYALRNSDIINQGVRLAKHNNIKTILLATFQDEDIFGDGTSEYLKTKSIEVQTAMKDDSFVIFSPFHLSDFPQSKSDLIKWCSQKGFDLSQTRSCYENTVEHCGKCIACENRFTAYSLAGSADTTNYNKRPLLPYHLRPEKRGIP